MRLATRTPVTAMLERCGTPLWNTVVEHRGSGRGDRQAAPIWECGAVEAERSGSGGHQVADRVVNPGSEQ